MFNLSHDFRTVLLKPLLRQILTGHSNREDVKSYCKDVMSKADELKINLPGYKATKEFYC